MRADPTVSLPQFGDEFVPDETSDRTQIENGAFAGYIVAKGDVQIKTPDNVSDEEAATLGISISTVVSTHPRYESSSKAF